MRGSAHANDDGQAAALGRLEDRVPTVVTALTDETGRTVEVTFTATVAPGIR